LKNNIKRFWEIDFFRGFFIILMILFHILYDLNHFNILKINFDSIFFQSYIYINATPFLLLVGISLTISYNRAKKTLVDKQLFTKFLFRGLKIFCYGLIITFITWLYLDEGFIIFGILHCIGLSIILAYPFLKIQKFIPLTGISLTAIGFILKTMTFDFYWFLWLGFIPTTFFTVDYFPLLPWFGVVLIGIFIGNTFYKENKRTFNLKDMSIFMPVKFICFIGRHSLVIYLIHQPIVIGLIHLIWL